MSFLSYMTLLYIISSMSVFCYIVMLYLCAILYFLYIIHFLVFILHHTLYLNATSVYLDLHLIFTSLSLFRCNPTFITILFVLCTMFWSSSVNLAVLYWHVLYPVDFGSDECKINWNWNWNWKESSNKMQWLCNNIFRVQDVKLHTHIVCDQRGTFY